MNLSDLPVFILFLAIVYLSIVYGLLKLAEGIKHDTTTSGNVVESKQRIKIP